MDNKYIENLEGSHEVDEGLWDRLKSRAAGYTQAAKNIAFKGTGETEVARFESLFKTFVKTTLETLTDMGKVLNPYESANKLTPEQIQKLHQYLDASKALQKVEKMKLAEANFFTRPFSLLGAIGSGNPQNIINAYAKQIVNSYNKFVDDARKLNIVPDEFIGRKISSIAPEVPDAMQKLSTAIGTNLGTAAPVATAPTTPSTTPAAASLASVPPRPPEPAPAAKPAAAPTSVPPSAIKPAPASTLPPAPAPASAAPVPGLPAPVAPSSPAAKPSPVAAAPSPAAAPATTPAAAPSGGKEITTESELTFSALQDAALKIGNSFSNKDFIEAAVHEVDKNRYKSQIVLPKEIQPFPVGSESAKLGKLVMNLRYRYGLPDQFIEYLSVRTMPDGAEREDPEWLTLFTYRVKDVGTEAGQTNTGFDIIEQIKKTNPELKKVIDAEEPKVGKAKVIKDASIKAAAGMHKVLMEIAPESERGERQLVKPGSASTTPAEKEKPTPPGSVAEPTEPATPETPKEVPPGATPPEKMARAKVVAKKPTGKKATAKPAAKPAAPAPAKAKAGKAKPAAAAPAAPAPTAKPKSGKKLSGDELKDYLRMKQKREVDENFNPSFKDFFGSL